MIGEKRNFPPPLFPHGFSLAIGRHGRTWAVTRCFVFMVSIPSALFGTQYLVECGRWTQRRDLIPGRSSMSLSGGCWFGVFIPGTWSLQDFEMWCGPAPPRRF